MNYTQNLQKWGNSTGIRLPKKVLSAAHLELGRTMIISLKNGSIVLTPTKNTVEYNLDSMLKGVTPANTHSEVDWGNDTGLEKTDD